MGLPIGSRVRANQRGSLPLLDGRSVAPADSLGNLVPGATFLPHPFHGGDVPLGFQSDLRSDVALPQEVAQLFNEFAHDASRIWTSAFWLE